MGRWEVGAHLMSSTTRRNEPCVLLLQKYPDVFNVRMCPGQRFQVVWVHLKTRLLTFQDIKSDGGPV